MTAWDLLVEHSSLTSGTAWEHLNAQVGGGGAVPGEVSIGLQLRTTLAVKGGMLTDIAVPVELVAVMPDTGRTCYSRLVSTDA